MKRLMIGLIRAYQSLLSPVLPPSCRFTPSCSNYAIEALRRHGVWSGSRLAVTRLLRCGPWCRGGFDPVPGTPHDGPSPATHDGMTALPICREGK